MTIPESEEGHKLLEMETEQLRTLREGVDGDDIAGRLSDSFCYSRIFCGFGGYISVFAAVPVNETNLLQQLQILTVHTN